MSTASNDDDRVSALKSACTSSLSALAHFTKAGGAALMSIASSAAIIADVTNTVNKTMDLVDKRKDTKAIDMVNGAIPIVNDMARIANNASRSIEQTGPIVESMSEAIRQLSDSAKSLKTVITGNRAKVVSHPNSQQTTPIQPSVSEEANNSVQRPGRR